MAKRWLIGVWILSKLFWRHWLHAQRWGIIGRSSHVSLTHRTSCIITILVVASHFPYSTSSGSQTLTDSRDYLPALIINAVLRDRWVKWFWAHRGWYWSSTTPRAALCSTIRACLPSVIRWISFSSIRVTQSRTTISLACCRWIRWYRLPRVKICTRKCRTRISNSSLISIWSSSRIELFTILKCLASLLNQLLFWI